MGQHILGLDFGSYSTKATLIEKNWSDFSVVGFFERINDLDPALTPHQQMTYNLQKFLEEYPLPPDTAVMVAVPAHLMGYRFLELPFTNAKKIEQSMDFELENHIPLDLEKVWFDYHVLSTDKTTSRILVAYTMLDDFMSLLSLCEKNDLNPRRIGGQEADLTLLAHVAMLPQAGQYALIDFGHHKTSLVIFENKELRHIRTFSVGSHALTQKIAVALGVSEAEAERLKCESLELYPSLDGNTPLAAVASKMIREWLVTIRQSLAAYTQSGESRRVEALYTLGGGSRLPGFHKVLSSELKMNVTTLDVLAFTPHTLREPASMMPSCAPSLATALGALRRPKQIDINLRRGDYAYRGDIEGVEQGAKAVAVWVAAIVAAGILHYSVSYMSLSGRVAQVHKQTTEILGKDLGATVKGKNFSLSSALSIVSGKIDELKKKIGDLAGDDAAPSPLAVLAEVSARMPKTDDKFKVDIDSLNVTETLVKMDGRTTSFEAVDKIKQALSESPQFADIKADNVAKGLKDEVKFSLSLAFAKKNPDEAVAGIKK